MITGGPDRAIFPGWSVSEHWHLPHLLSGRASSRSINRHPEGRSGVEQIAIEIDLIYSGEMASGVCDGSRAASSDSADNLDVCKRARDPAVHPALAEKAT